MAKPKIADAPALFGDPVLDDFRNFLYVVHQHLGLPDPTPVQYDIAHYLQHGPKHFIIEAFRGVGKSHITSAFVIWLLLRDPQLNILVVSATKVRSDEFSTFVKRLISEMPILAHLQPKEGQRDSMISFDVAPATNNQFPSVKSVGITGQITGGRADVIVADDIEVPNNSATDLMRDQLASRVQEFAAVLKPKATSRTVFLGTPQTEQSLYNKLVEEHHYAIRIWPAEVPEKPERYKGHLAPMIQAMIDEGVPVGTPCDPKRFSREELDDKRSKYARSGYALQFMLDTSLSDLDRYPLRLRDLHVMYLDLQRGPPSLTWSNAPENRWPDLPNVGLPGDGLYRPFDIGKETLEYTGCVMSIDPSGKGKDETSYAVVKMLHGTQFVLDVGGFTDGYAESTLLALAKTAKKYEVKYIICEENFGGGMFAQLLKPVLSGREVKYPCTIEEVRHSVQKEKRMADVLEPVMNSHRLVFDANLVKRDFDTPEQRRQLFYQMTRLTRDKGALQHDDRLDALSMAVQYWVEAMARDTEVAFDEAKEQALRDELEDFMDHVLGKGSPAGDTWFDSPF
jgi:hypothetical protein